ncbi:HAMP domain-containing histidine kinase [Alicyclobacillus tolerans]|uniref:sensor histidine kinase n=1 Tax=Alicyclobacillus tolerans TaxID=90970 RepID=UPI001F4787F3|nr:ATP-binding protein [Alicyclobacillus tolerans]MCF8567218.1 HAMP domain-containing histidine kinase [Alicyclobacillus tolerans]
MLTVGIVLLLYIITSVSVYTIVQQVVIRSIDTRITGIVNQLATTDVQTVINSLSPESETYLLFVTPNQFMTNLPPSLDTEVANLFNTHPRRSHWVVNFSEGDNQFRMVYFPIGVSSADPTMLPARYILIVTNITRELAVLSRLGEVLLFVGIAGTVLATLAGFFLAERTLRPVRKAWQRQVDFVADASHELRTPLAVIQSNLDIVLDHSNEGVLDNLEWINNAHNEARRLSKLVADLLTLARSDSQAAALHMDDVDLSALLDHLVELFQTVAQAGELSLTQEIEPNIHIQGDKSRLHQLFVILLDNACKYTNPGGSIYLSLASQKGGAIVRISDTGQGIDEQDIDRVFERFYRADKARERDGASGAGLGLAIAKWVAEAHGGKIQLQSQVGQGTTVTVQLPL